MKKIGCLLFVILLVVACIFLFPPKSAEEQIEDTIGRFVEAYNSGDSEKMLKYFDAKTRNAIEGWSNILGGALGKYAGFGIDMNDLFSMGVGLWDGDFIQVDVSEIKMIDESHAIAVGNMKIQIAETPIYFIMVREDYRWVIANMTDDLPSEYKGLI